MPIDDTSGPLFTRLSPHAGLQRSLENRLRESWGVSGSPEYALTWATQDMPSGPPICQLRALARRTGGNGCSGSLSGWATPRSAETGHSSGNPERAENHKSRLEDQVHLSGWPTPEATESHHGTRGASPRRIAKRIAEGRQLSMAETVQLTGWPTPMAGNPGTENYNPAGNTDSSRKTVAMLTGWPTTSARDWKDGRASQATLSRNARPLSEVAMLTGWATPAANPANGEPEAFLERKRRAVAKGSKMGVALTDLQMQAKLSGPALSPSSSAMANGSESRPKLTLNPGFCLWLMLGELARPWLAAAQRVQLKKRNRT